MAIEFTDLILHFDQVLPILIQQHGAWVYALLFALVFLQIGVPPMFFLPGNPVLFVAGAMCAGQGLSLYVVIPLFFCATFLGSLLNFSASKFVGHRLLSKHQRWISPNAYQKAHHFYETYGIYTFVFTPFIAMIRTFGPVASGVAEMSTRKFIYSASVGAALWSISVPLAGFYVGDVPIFKAHLGSLLLVGLGIGLGLVVVGLLFSVLGKRSMPQND